MNKIDNNGAATGTVTPISSLAFTYTDNQTFITDQDGNREIYVFASDGNLAEYYKEQERRIVKAEKYTYQAYSKQETKSARKDTLYKTQYEAFAFTDGNTTTVTLNEFNQAVREVQTIEADGAEPARTYETEFTYDGGNRQVLSGKQTKVTYALGSGSKSYTQVEQHEYDEQYRAMSTTQYVSGEENGKGKLIHEIVYAPSGTVWKESVYNSRNTGMKYCQEYAYDELGRIQSKFNEFGTDYKAYSYIGGLNTGSTLVNTERTYFGSGSEAEGWKTYSYDSANRVSAMNYKINYFSEGVHSISYQNGQVTKLTDGKYTLLYTYDAKRRVTNVNVNGDSYVSMAYTDSATENGKRVDKVTATYIARASGVQDSFTQVSDKFGNTLRVEYNGDTLMEGSYHADSRPDQLIDHVSGETEQYH